MNSSVFVLCVLACIAAVNCGFVEDITAVVHKCAADHNIAGDVLSQINTYSYISTLDASEDVKCYSKCTGDNSEYFNADKSINYEFYTKFSAPAQKTDACLRSIYDYCTAITPFATDCDKSWAVFVCLQNYTC